MPRAEKPLSHARPGIVFTPGEHKVGRGKVVVLENIPTDEKSPQAHLLVAAVNKAGASTAIKVDKYVNQAVFTKGSKTYLVLYNTMKAMSREAASTNIISL